MKQTYTVEGIYYNYGFEGDFDVPVVMVSPVHFVGDSGSYGGGACVDYLVENVTIDLMLDGKLPTTEADPKFISSMRGLMTKAKKGTTKKVGYWKRVIELDTEDEQHYRLIESVG